MDINIRRAFADLPHGQVHYRHAGAGEPLLLLHGSPGSSQQMAPLIQSFAPTAQVIAPDTPGNGDSVPLSGDSYDIADLAHAALALLNTLQIDNAQVYGTHTGAAIAAELAIIAPSRIKAVVLDGVSDLDGDQLAEFLAHYAPPFEADLEGDYLTRLFQFCRDQYRYFPWYRHTPESQRTGPLPNPDDLAALVLETMKARTSYHRNYHAAFRWDAKARLPLIPCPAVLMASLADPLFETTQALAQFLPGHRFHALPPYDAPGFSVARQTIMAQFMAMED